MSISIDEMIKSGKTLSEIQKELRTQVAARDESALKKEKAIVDKRTSMLLAIVEWLETCGLKFEPKELDSVLKDVEKECVKVEKQIKDVVAAEDFIKKVFDKKDAAAPAKTVANAKAESADKATTAAKDNKSTEDSIDFESLDWLRDFIGLL